MMIHQFKPREVGKARIVEFLTKCSNAYPLEIGNTELDQWPQKIDQYAEAFCYLDENGIITAALFFYCNDLQSKQAYVTFICSLPGTPQGTAYELHKRYIEYSRNQGMLFSRLEVLKSNTHALAFYNRQGYCEVEDHDTKLLLQLGL